jgi:hypothetical protein
MGWGVPCLTAFVFSMNLCQMICVHSWYLAVVLAQNQHGYTIELDEKISGVMPGMAHDDSI